MVKAGLLDPDESAIPEESTQDLSMSNPLSSDRGTVKTDSTYKADHSYATTLKAGVNDTCVKYESLSQQQRWAEMSEYGSEVPPDRTRISHKPPGSNLDKTFYYDGNLSFQFLNDSNSIEIDVRDMAEFER